MTYFRILAAGLALMAGGVTQATKPTTLESLQGTWVLTSINGQAAPDGAPELSLTFAGDKYHQAIGAEINERGTFKVDAAAKPVTIDLSITEGSDAGKTQLGIVEVTDGTVRCILDTPGAKQRPTDFTVKDGFIMFVGKKKQ